MDSTCFRILATIVVGASFFCSSSFSDELKITRDGKQRVLQGELLIHAKDDSILFRQSNGHLWVLKTEEYDEVSDLEVEFKSLTQKEMAASLLEELPEGFEIHTTKNYVIAYNTSHAYARWVGALYERLYSGFRNYWKTKRFRLHDPDVPMVVIAFDSLASYTRFVQHELGQEPGSMVAYYNLVTNRVAMYDLTGAQASARLRESASTKQINTMLSHPNAAAMVATVVHEATHQIMFNCGMQQRLADTPLWLNEGLAVFFETPDLKSKRGWRGMGKVNNLRLHGFRAFLSRRGPDSLRTLIQDDKRFRDPEQMLDAYAESWALNYFLLKRESKSFVRYLEEVSQLKPLRTTGPEARIELFEKHFGPLEELDEQLIKYCRKLSAD